MNARIELSAVHKRYGSADVLSDVSFACPAGTITVFCGPNGAGKSTALRIIAGITRPDSGEARVSGQRVQDLPDVARAVGSLLDASAFHPGRSVRETLRLAAFTIGEPRRRADECAALVGLETVATRRVGALSLGMRQRLGIAHALVGHPRALVLDEPSNGLDPEGIQWLERFLRHFADGGGTALVSTHHLAAAERTADRVVAISRGRIVADGDIEELIGPRTLVRAVEEDRLVEALRAAGGEPSQSVDGVVVELPLTQVGRVAHDAGIPLCELRAARTPLDAYLTAVTDPEFRGRPS